MLTEGKHFQVLESVEADFDKMTWSFSIQDRHHVAAGHYAIVDAGLMAKNNAKLAAAEGLLRSVIDTNTPVAVGSTLYEQLLRYFDPEPL